jgi:hypothetical protein
MDDIPFLWMFLDDVNMDNFHSGSRERITESANEEINTHSIEFD